MRLAQLHDGMVHLHHLEPLQLHQRRNRAPHPQRVVLDVARRFRYRRPTTARNRELRAWRGVGEDAAGGTLIQDTSVVK
jgi:hypothetical protein